MRNDHHTSTVDAAAFSARLDAPEPVEHPSPDELDYHHQPRTSLPSLEQMANEMRAVLARSKT